MLIYSFIESKHRADMHIGYTVCLIMHHCPTYGVGTLIGYPKGCPGVLCKYVLLHFKIQIISEKCCNVCWK